MEGKCETLTFYYFLLKLKRMNEGRVKKGTHIYDCLFFSLLHISFLKYVVMVVVEAEIPVQCFGFIQHNSIMFSYFILFLATPHGLWEFSSPTRDLTWALGTESVES